MWCKRCLASKVLGIKAVCCKNGCLVVKGAWCKSVCCKSCLVQKVPLDCDISTSKYHCFGLSGYPASSFLLGVFCYLFLFLCFGSCSLLVFGMRHFCPVTLRCCTVETKLERFLTTISIPEIRKD